MHSPDAPQNKTMLSQKELSLRWGKPASVIGLLSAMGIGPKYVKKLDGVMYPIEDVQRYEQSKSVQ